MFSFTTITDYHSWLKEEGGTCIQATEHFLSKIETAETLNAFVKVYAAEARQRARQLDEKRLAGVPMGKLHGVIIAIKDVISYKKHPLTAASAILKDFKAIYSATAVENLLKEDAIIIGSLNCDEFAMGSTNENSVYGPVKNGIDPAKIPGGSSGGSAVAVQAGLCMISLGSDTGGSVRQPADHCGIIGMKPTYGRISRYGLIAYASSFDQIGVFAKNVPDIALTLEVIAGADNYDSTVSKKPVEAYSKELDTGKKFRIAYFKEALEYKGLDKEIRDAIASQLDKLKAAGHTVEPVAFELIDYVVPTYYVLTTAEASSNLSRFDGVRFGHRTVSPKADLLTMYKKSRIEGFGKEVQRRIMLGTFVLSAGYYDAYFSKAQKVRNLLTKNIELIFRDFDVILLPTVPAPAYNIGEKVNDPIAMYIADIYTVIANLTGIPAISLPLFKHSNGMPFGLQVMTNRFKELPLLSFSYQLMKTQDHQTI